MAHSIVAKTELILPKCNHNTAKHVWQVCTTPEANFGSKNFQKSKLKKWEVETKIQFRSRGTWLPFFLALFIAYNNKQTIRGCQSHKILKQLSCTSDERKTRKKNAAIKSWACKVKLLGGLRSRGVESENKGSLDLSDLAAWWARATLLRQGENWESWAYSAHCFMAPQPLLSAVEKTSSLNEALCCSLISSFVHQEEEVY